MDEMSDLIARLEKAISVMEANSETLNQTTAERYRRMLHKSVLVLEQTKGSFRSNRLKELREQILETLNHPQQRS